LFASAGASREASVIPNLQMHIEGSTVVGMERVGRLGNQLFLFANLIALSLFTGASVAHPTLGRYANYFTGTASSLFCRFPLKQRAFLTRSNFLRVVVYYMCRALDRSGMLKQTSGEALYEGDYSSVVDMSQKSFLKRLTAHKLLFITKGWTYRYPNVNKDTFLAELNRHFALIEPYSSNVAQTVKSARGTHAVLVGVHIRHTDFKQHRGGKYYFTTEGYAKIMRHIQLLLYPATVSFLVVSDVKHTTAQFPLLSCTFGSGVDVEDMYCLGACDYIIGSVGSSFVLWPAFLFQKPIYRIEDADYLPDLRDFRVTMGEWSVT
jgi:hypothetical protein